MSEKEINKIKEQKMVEESDNKLSEALFSNNPHFIDRTSSIDIKKIDKNKFITIINEKQIKPTIKPTIKLVNKCFDLNDYDYDYDYDYIEFEEEY